MGCLRLSLLVGLRAIRSDGEGNGDGDGGDAMKTVLCREASVLELSVKEHSVEESYVNELSVEMIDLLAPIPLGNPKGTPQSFNLGKPERGGGRKELGREAD